MFNHSEILTAAWADYRYQKKGALNPAFSRFKFKCCLQWAWKCAKRRAAVEAQVAAEPKFSPAVEAIRNELLVMELSDAPINWERHRALNLELFRAGAAAA